jgi:3-methyladenine DNA glycosylase/8-oxoguanine DNA glycosylase
VPRRTIRSPLPVDLPASLSAVRAGRGDPAVLLPADEAAIATRTPAGPATLHLRGRGTLIEAEAWGPGAALLLEEAPGWCGALDDLTGFTPAHRVVSELARRRTGLRVVRTGRVVESLVRAVIGQKVTGREAAASYRSMAVALGEPAPGPFPLLVPPDPEVLAGLGSHRFHPWGIERKRAETVIRVARRSGRLEEAAAMPLPEASARLGAVAGVGPWTAAIVAGHALGDPDAVPVGDFNIPNLVAWALAGEPRGDDRRMLELLAPYAGHRGRVIRLLKSAGIRPPRFGPRSPTRSFRSS